MLNTRLVLGWNVGVIAMFFHMCPGKKNETGPKQKRGTPSPSTAPVHKGTRGQYFWKRGQQTGAKLNRVKNHHWSPSSIRYLGNNLVSVSPDNIGVRNLPLRDMISLGARRMGLGCSGKILSSPSPPSPTRIWKMATSRVSLRNRRFRSARIDPSRRAVAEGYIYVHRIDKNRISKNSWKTINNGKKQA